MWTTLSERARLFAIDLPGFGASERRDDLLSPRAMGRFLAQLIVEADLGPHIAPDVGTSAAMFAAAAHPERIASLIVGSGGAAAPIQLGGHLESWVLDPDFEKFRRMDARATVGASLDMHAGGLRIVVNHRPLRSVLLWSQLMGEHFAGTHYAKYFLSHGAAEALAMGTR